MRWQINYLKATKLVELIRWLDNRFFIKVTLKVNLIIGIIWLKNKQIYSKN